jgi:hypothetical protein
MFGSSLPPVVCRRAHIFVLYFFFSLLVPYAASFSGLSFFLLSLRYSLTFINPATFLLKCLYQVRSVNNRKFIVLGISILFLSTIFIFGFENLLTVWYFLFVYHLITH